MASNRIKGITIEIGGDTTNLQKSLKAVDSSLKNTESQLKDVNKLLKLDPKNTELLAQKNELLSKAIEDTNSKLAQEKLALEQLKAGDQTDETIQQQKNLEREIIATEQQLKSYQQELGKTEISLESVGKKAEIVAQKTKALSTAAAGLSAALLGNAFSAAKTADDLSTLSQQTGFSVEELQKMDYASNLVDVSLDSMTGSLKKMTKQMGSGSKTFDKLGVSIYDQNGEMRDAVEVWYECLEALGDIDNETERDTLAMDLFGKSASDLAGIIDDGGKALKDYGEEAEDLGLILGKDDVEAAHAFNDEVDKMKKRASQAFLQMGASLASTLVPALEKLVAWVTKVVQWFANLSGTTQKTILIIASLVAAISPVAGIISKIITVVTGLSSAFAFLALPVGIAVAAIAAAVAIGVTLYKNWDTIKAKASELWGSISATFNNIKTSISNSINAAKDAVYNAVEKIKSFFNFNWSLPHIKLPHFKVTGGFSWSLAKGVTFPSISVDWYKKAMKNGMILNSPTIFGAMNGKLLGAGEAGSETVVGTNSLMSMIQSAVGSASPVINMTVNATDQNVYQLADLVIDRLVQQTSRNGMVFR